MQAVVIYRAEVELGGPRVGHGAHYVLVVQEGGREGAADGDLVAGHALELKGGRKEGKAE